MPTKPNPMPLEAQYPGKAEALNRSRMKLLAAGLSPEQAEQVLEGATNKMLNSRIKQIAEEGEATGQTYSRQEIMEAAQQSFGNAPSSEARGRNEPEGAGYGLPEEVAEGAMSFLDPRKFGPMQLPYAGYQALRGDPRGAAGTLLGPAAPTILSGLAQGSELGGQYGGEATEQQALRMGASPEVGQAASYAVDELIRNIGAGQSLSEVQDPREAAAQAVLGPGYPAFMTGMGALGALAPVGEVAGAGGKLLKKVPGRKTAALAAENARLARQIADEAATPEALLDDLLIKRAAADEPPLPLVRGTEIPAAPDVIPQRGGLPLPPAERGPQLPPDNDLMRLFEEAAAADAQAEARRGLGALQPGFADDQARLAMENAGRAPASREAFLEALQRDAQEAAHPGALEENPAQTLLQLQRGALPPQPRFARPTRARPLAYKAPPGVVPLDPDNFPTKVSRLLSEGELAARSRTEGAGIPSEAPGRGVIPGEPPTGEVTVKRFLDDLHLADRTRLAGAERRFDEGQALRGPQGPEGDVIGGPPPRARAFRPVGPGVQQANPGMSSPSRPRIVADANTSIGITAKIEALIAAGQEVPLELAERQVAALAGETNVALKKSAFDAATAAVRAGNFDRAYGIINRAENSAGVSQRGARAESALRLGLPPGQGFEEQLRNVQRDVGTSRRPPSAIGREIELSPDEAARQRADYQKALRDYLKKSGRLRAGIGSPEDIDRLVSAAGGALRSTFRALGEGPEAAARKFANLIPKDQRVLFMKTILGADETAGLIDAVKLGKPFTALDPQVREAVKKMATGEWAVPPAAIAKQVQKAMREMGETVFKKIGEQEKEIDKLLGTKFAERRAVLGNVYLRRQYYSRLLPGWKPTAEVRNATRDWLVETSKVTPQEADLVLDEILAGQVSASTKIAGVKDPAAMFSSALQARENVPPMIRKFLGEVQDGTHLAMITLADQERVLANARFFRKLDTKLPEIIARHPNEKLVRLSEQATMPNLPAFGVEQKQIVGALWDKPIPQFLAEEITDMYHSTDALTRWIQGGQGLLKRKFTSWNPSTHLNNIFGNMFFSHAAGNTPANPLNWPHYKDALIGLLKRDDLYEEAVRNGALSGQTFSREARDYLEQIARQMAESQDNSPSALLKAWTAAKQAGRKIKGGDAALGALYDLEDQWFKLALYKKARAGGIRPGRFAAKEYQVMAQAASKAGPEGAKAAAEYVNRLMPNYNWVGLTLRQGRKTPLASLIANPFVAFPAEAARVGYNSMRANPLGVGLMGMGLYTAANYGGMVTGATDKEVADARAKLPTYQREHLLIPYKGATGIEFIDLTYKFPLAEAVFGFKPSLAKEGFQGKERLAHAIDSVALGGWLQRSTVGEDEPADFREFSARFRQIIGQPPKTVRAALKREGGAVAGEVASALLPPSVGREAESFLARRRGVTTNKFQEPISGPGTALLGLRPVFSQSNRGALERKAVVGEAKKFGKKTVGEAGRAGDTEGQDEARERLREILKNIRENRQ